MFSIFVIKYTKETRRRKQHEIKKKLKIKYLRETEENNVKISFHQEGIKIREEFEQQQNTFLMFASLFPWFSI